VALLGFLPVGALTAGVVAALGAKSGFSEAVQSFDFHKNMLGDINGTMLLVCSAFLMAKSHPNLRWFLWFFSLTSFAGIIANQARASLLGTVCGFLLMLGASRMRLRYAFLAVVTIMLGFWALINILPPEVREYAFSTSRHSSNQARIAS